MKEKLFEIYRTTEFKTWYAQQEGKSRLHIDHRLSMIQDDGHFGDYKYIGSKSEPLFELRWKNGRRLYFTYLVSKKILLLLGGNKNGQEKDITKAKRLIKKYAD